MTEELVDQQILSHVKKLTAKQKQRLLAKIIAKKPVKRTSACRPRAEPMEKWTPKDPKKAEAVLKQLLDGVGVIYANVAGGLFDVKIMTSDLAAAAIGQSQTDRSALAASSLLVSALLARILERAAKQKEDEGMEAAVFEMQGHRSTAGFHRSRGSGLATNRAGLDLIKGAAAALRTRLLQVEA